MGIYYHLPPANLGAQQPLAPTHVPPPSGPLPGTPLFGGAALAATLVAAWSATAAPLPQRAPVLVAPPTASAVPVPRTGVPPEILAWWQPEAPFAASRPGTPNSGPTPQTPPLSGGAAIPAAVLIQWLPPPPYPPQAVNLDPPVSGPTPQTPPPLVRRTDWGWTPAEYRLPPRVVPVWPAPTGAVPVIRTDTAALEIWWGARPEPAPPARRFLVPSAPASSMPPPGTRADPVLEIWWGRRPDDLPRPRALAVFGLPVPVPAIATAADAVLTIALPGDLALTDASASDMPVSET